MPRWWLCWACFAAFGHAQFEAQEYFRARVETAIERVRAILNETRSPQYPVDVPHTYDDKYMLAEEAIKAAAAGLFNVFEALSPGWWAASREAALRARAAGQPLSLRFSGCRRCDFERTEEKETDAGSTEVRQTGWVSSTVKVVKKHLEHHWAFSSDWNITLLVGLDDAVGRPLIEHRSGLKLLTRTPPEAERTPPQPPVTCDTSHELSLNWLVDLMRGGELGFTINRTAARTPRRNAEVEVALNFFVDTSVWARAAVDFLDRLLEVDARPGAYRRPAAQQPHQPAAASFRLVAGMFTLDGANTGGQLSLASSSERLLEAHRRSLQQDVERQLLQLPAQPSAGGGLATGDIVRTHALLEHLLEHELDVMAALGTVEGMLTAQLVSAVGKEIGSRDFAEYMDYHTQRLFRAEYAQRFSFAVRRPGKAPEGAVSIEGYFSGQLDQKELPVLTLARRRSAGSAPALRLPLSAAVDVAIGGERHLHALVLHSFASEPKLSLKLIARARQFSSFILIVGRIAPGDRLEPAAALIIKDRDDLLVPILLETLPTPKEFRDAIESLSPEQQRFAKAFRAMQLAGTLFGICIVQIKPQMELLLNLPHDALTKEIQLTQDLMKLFIQYQVPPDLLSFDGPAEVSSQEKLQAVRGHVAALWSTINASRQQELDEARGKAEKRTLDAEGCPAGQSCGRGGSLRADDAAEPKVLELKLRPIEATEILQTRFSFGLEAAAAPASMATAHTSGAPVVQGRGLHQGRTLLQSDSPPPQPSPTFQTSSSAEDLASLPQRLDKRVEALDPQAALRATRLALGPAWTKREQSGLLSPLTERVLTADGQKAEQDSAFDLLDALSRSGALPVEHASLHVVLAATHGFDQTLIQTVVQGNVNPIENVESSLLIMASTVLGVPAESLLESGQVERLRLSAPQLFDT